MASLPALIKSAEEDLGLPKRVTGFVLPMAVSMFKIAGPVSWTVGALFVGWFYGVPLHARELATIAFAAVFLTRPRRVCRAAPSSCSRRCSSPSASRPRASAS